MDSWHEHALYISHARTRWEKSLFSAKKMENPIDIFGGNGIIKGS